MYEYVAKVVNVVDGDTMDLVVDLGFRISHKVRVRLLGIDTPEKFGVERPLGEICKEFAKQTWLDKEVIINSEKEEDLNTDSFGRWLVKMRFLNAELNDDAIALYTNLGINKKTANYNENNVLALKERMENGISD